MEEINSQLALRVGYQIFKARSVFNAVTWWMFQKRDVAA
ncbi:hypothetical protein A0O32_1729 [Anoxybacillus flavithermus]|uniref:Uncharacterized protein n=1 Tax=Anoxybacillus flavithermus TaxID=33934 RepID=A0A178TE01_9BACL|nr:hypothetical protein A0O32_1729 [Anoxybacillus flavithermus]OAO80348.1 hypothetical protein TAF16_1111 [Anoxybacillus flavithermus]